MGAVIKDTFFIRCCAGDARAETAKQAKERREAQAQGACTELWSRSLPKGPRDVSDAPKRPLFQRLTPAQRKFMGAVLTETFFILCCAGAARDEAAERAKDARREEQAQGVCPKLWAQICMLYFLLLTLLSQRKSEHKTTRKRKRHTLRHMHRHTFFL